MLIMRINQQYAQIGIKSTAPRLDMKTTLPRLEVETIPGQLDISSPNPQLHIDQSKCFADAGLKTPEMLLDSVWSQAKSDALAAIEGIVQEGNQFASVKGPSPGDILLNRYTSGQQHEFGIKAMPQQPPEIWAEVYPIQVEYTPAQVQGTVIPGSIENNFQWGQISVYLQQRNEISMYCSGQLLDAVA